MRTSFFRAFLESAVLLAVLLGLGRWLVGLFTRRPTVYQLTAGRQLQLAFWPLLAVGTGLSVLPALAFKAMPISLFEWLLAGSFVAITLVLGGPALLLHLRYHSANATTQLAFAPGQGVLQLTEPETTGYYPPRDGWPSQASWSRCRWPSVFWRRYEYLLLTLHDGRQVLLTSLLLDLEPLVAYLRHYRVPVLVQQRAWAWPSFSATGTGPA